MVLRRLNGNFEKSSEKKIKLIKKLIGLKMSRILTFLQIELFI